MVKDELNIGIVCYPSIGGSGIVATILGNALCAWGFRVHFISYDTLPRLRELAPHCLFHHVDVPDYYVFRYPPYTLALASELCRITEEHNIPLVHVHYAVPHSTAAVWAKDMRKKLHGNDTKIITTLHGTDSYLVGQIPSCKPIVEFSINSSDMVTAVSNHLKKSVEDTFNISDEIRVVYNPMDTGLFVPKKKKHKRKNKVLLHISNLRPIKRVMDAIHIFNMVQRVIPAQLWIVGEGPDLESAQQLAQKLGIKDSVKFKRSVLKIEEILEEADLLLSTSEVESFGLTVAEAMAMEIPVVAYGVGGIPEVIGNPDVGVTVPFGKTCTAAEAAIDILSNCEKAHNMGKAARRYIVDNFELDKIVYQYINIYSEVLGMKLL